MTFVFNGGPGASSRFGCNSATSDLRRLAITGDAANSSASPDLQPNAETWLDFTDLVFIDPVGTGYSEPLRRHRSVDGDVSSIALTIQARWLEKSDRRADRLKY